MPLHVLIDLQDVRPSVVRLFIITLSQSSLLGAYASHPFLVPYSLLERLIPQVSQPDSA